MTNANTTNTTTASSTKIDRKSAAAALSAMGNIVHGERGAKKAEREKAKAERKAARVESILVVLTTGETGRKDGKFDYRMALTKAVSAVKQGATAQQLHGCTALHKAAKWDTLIADDSAQCPITAFATAKGCDPAVLIAGLVAPAEKPVVVAPAKPAKGAAIPKAPASKAPAAKPAKAEKPARKPRAKKAAKGATKAA